MSAWRYPHERDELVERVIRAEKARRVAEEKARALMAGQDDAVTLLAARVMELEDIVRRLNEARARRAS